MNVNNWFKKGGSRDAANLAEAIAKREELRVMIVDRRRQLESLREYVISLEDCSIDKESAARLGLPDAPRGAFTKWRINRKVNSRIKRIVREIEGM
jgi:hypothetical protein